MNPDQNAYKEQVPPAPLLMSQLAVPVNEQLRDSREWHCTRFPNRRW